MNFQKINPFSLHSFLKIFFILWLVRFTMSFSVFVYEMMGEYTPPLSEFLFTQLWQIGELILMVLFFYTIIKIGLPKLIVYIFLYPFCLLLILWAIADPIVFTLAGDHITPSLLSHFAGPKILFSDDLWLPMKKNAILVITGLIVMSVLLYALYRLFKKSYREDFVLIKYKVLLSLGIVGLVLIFMPNIFKMTYLTYPAEMLYARDYYGWNRYFPEDTDIDRIRNTFNKPINKDWISEDYPLVHTNTSEQVNDSRPDVILFVKESFRAKSAKIFDPINGDLDFPALERIANNGISFPYFISNGFPSTEGFFNLLTGTWPHSRKRIVENYEAMEFDNIATHLNNIDYKTLRVDFDPGAYAEGFWVKKYYAEAISFLNRKIFPSEKNMVNKTISYIQNHDSTSTKPLFIHFKTKSPHYPYEFPDDSISKYIEVGSPSENYKAGMQYVDVQIGRLYDYLQTRDRKNNTVIIITGDHSNYLDKALATALPVDDVLWTGAIIAGNQSLVGKVRTDDSHCSQMDILPTILNLTGDTSPRVSLGRDLLDSNYNPSETFSFAVRPSGVRIDKGGYTYIVDRRHPSQFIKQAAFGGIMPEKKESEKLLSPENYLRIADTWSYLIEENKVWDVTIIK